MRSSDTPQTEHKPDPAFFARILAGREATERGDLAEAEAIFLSLLEKHEAKSDKLYAGVAKMLEHKNFFFSRRAHAFLKDKELPPQLKAKLTAYEKRHEKRL